MSHAACQIIIRDAIDERSSRLAHEASFSWESIAIAKDAIRRTANVCKNMRIRREQTWLQGFARRIARNDEEERIRLKIIISIMPCRKPPPQSPFCPLPRGPLRGGCFPHRGKRVLNGRVSEPPPPSGEVPIPHLFRGKRCGRGGGGFLQGISIVIMERRVVIIPPMDCVKRSVIPRRESERISRFLEKAY